MAYYLPAEPDYTCPLIDEVIEWVVGFDASTEFDKMSVEELRTFVNRFDEHRDEILIRMEEIRSANDALRRRQKYFREELEKKEEKLESAEEKAAERQAMLEEYERTAPL